MIRLSSSYPYGRWQWVIEGKTAHKFRDMIDNGNIEETKSASIVLLEEIKSVAENKKAIRYLNNMIKKFKEVENDEKKIDKLLDKLYDFCDESAIFISF